MGDLMSSYHCEVCGHDGPLSEPCPVCEPAVREALQGRRDWQEEEIRVPLAETKAVLARLDAMRLDYAVLVEKLAQKNREIQAFQEELSTCREAMGKTRIEADKAITEATFARDELKHAHAQILKLAMDLDEARKR